MPKIEIKSLVIGLVLGFFILPRVVSFATGKVAELKSSDS